MRLPELDEFLACPTPDAWVEAALEHLDLMLIDHAHCERKAASTALSLMFRYTGNEDLQHRMSRLVREEMRHYEQVLAILKKRGVAFRPIEPARYASGMRELIRTHEPARLIDTLIVGAFIEARSCERFRKLAPHLAPDLSRFYERLQTSEARHFHDYLELALDVVGREGEDALNERVAEFGAREAELIETPDEQFRFHSGVFAITVPSSLQAALAV